MLGIHPSVILADHIGYSGTDSSGIYLDQKLIQKMNYRNGVFIEVGAYDGIAQSNTMLLEELYGWTGILIEPSEVLFPILSRNRPNARCFQCALGSFQENNTYVYGDFNGTPMSSVGGKRLNNSPNIRVFVRSLQSILDEVRLQHINFFSLDTEGYELNILKGIDFSKTIFDYMLIEIYTDQYNDIIAFLKSKGYDLVENVTNFNRAVNPDYDGTHNDYLFKRADLQ